MKKLIEFFARQGIFADLLTLFIILLGIASVLLIRREAFPNITYDIVTISTLFPGASPGELERLITNPIEQDLKEVDGIKRLTSVSIEGQSVLVAQLDPDQTTELEGKTDIQEIVDRFNTLPEGAEEPDVNSIESKLVPVIEVTVAGNLSDIELRKIAKRVETEIETIQEVARVTYKGLRDLEIRVDADPKKLTRYGLTLEDLVNSLKKQNLSIPGGTLNRVMPDGRIQEQLVRTVGEFSSSDDVANTVVRANELARTIRVKDVAHVSYGLEDPKEMVRTNGEPSISLTVLKKEKADAIELVDKLKEKLKQLEPRLGEDISIGFVNDQSYYIRRRLNILTNNLGVGLLLVLCVLSLILPFRVALLVSLGIPLGFLGTIIVFYTGGTSLNLITMMGLIIVCGMLVDDAVVVTDNAVRHIEDGKKPLDAAIVGTQQVWNSVTASVMTTIVAFLPMMFMSGIFGKFVRYIPVGVVIALLISLFECFFILPHHIARWIKAEKRVGKQNRGFQRILAYTEYIWDHKLTPFYLRVLKKAVNRRYFVATGTLALFIGSVALAKFGMIFTLFPSDGIETFFININTPTGTPIEETSRLIKGVEANVKKLPDAELKDFITRIGKQQKTQDDGNTKRGSQYAQIVVYLTPATERERKAKDIIEQLRSDVGTPPGLEKVTFDRVKAGPPSDKPISIGIRGETYDTILPAAEALKNMLKEKVPSVTDIDDSYVEGKEELRIQVNEAEAAASGLSVRAIGNVVRAAYEGIISTSIRKLNEEIDIRVSLPKDSQSQVETLQNLMIPNNLGNLIPLSRVAKITRTRDIAVYEHEANKRQIRVTSDLDQRHLSATDANDIVRKNLPSLQKKFPDVTFNFGGEDQDTKESMASLMRAFVVASMGILLILIMTFKQILQPFLVLLTIPLGIIAVIWSFFLHGMPLSFMAMLGIIALAGVIVNNAIVYVDFVNQYRGRGMDRWESIYKAASVRIRPIFLTTVTTVCGILPTAYGIGGLDPFVVPIALALGWGMAFGSFLTTLIFPAALAILDDVNHLISKIQSNSRAKNALNT